MNIFDDLSKLATTQVNVVGMLVLLLLILSLAVLIYVWKRPTAQQETTDNEVLRLLIEQFGSISTELRGFAKAVKDDSAETTTEHGEIVTTLQTMNTLLMRVVNGNDDVVKSVDKLSENLGAYTNEVKQTGAQIMETVTPMDDVLEAIHTELRLLRISVDTHMENEVKFRDEVIDKTQTIEDRLAQVEKRATQETPAVLHPIPKKPGVPVTPKPKEATEGKTE